MAWTTGVQFPAGAMMEFFLFATASSAALGLTQQPIQQILAIIPEDKATGA